MPDTTPADRPAESLLGPITPIRCTVTGCHWAVHGVPDKYAGSRARIVREHVAAEHTPTPESASRPADLLRAAVRAIHALKSPTPDGSPHYQSGWDDGLEAAMDAVRGMDLAVARQLLGTTTVTRTDLGPADGQQKMRLLTELHASLTPIPEETDEEREQREDREETDREHAVGIHTHCGLTCEVDLPTEHLRNFVIAKGYPGTAGALDELLRRATAAAPPAPADRAAILRVVDRLAAHAAGFQDVLDESDRGPWGKTIGADIAELSRLAGEAAAGVQPPGGFTTRVCRNCSRTITWVPDGTWTHEPHNPDGGHIAAPYTLPAECHASAAPAAPEEPTR